MFRWPVLTAIVACMAISAAAAAARRSPVVLHCAAEPGLRKQGPDPAAVCERFRLAAERALRRPVSLSADAAVRGPRWIAVALSRPRANAIEARVTSAIERRERRLAPIAIDVADRRLTIGDVDSLAAAVADRLISK